MRVFKWLAAIAAVVVFLFGVVPYLFLYSIAWSNVSKIQEYAARGYPDDQCLLGEWYLTGRAESRTMGIVKQDNERALLWLGAAAKKKYTKAYAPYARALEKAGQQAAVNEWRAKAKRAGETDHYRNQ